jgi:hypothetical protein
MLDLTVIDQAGTRTEQVSVPDTVAAGRIAARLAQAMGLPQTRADGQPIAYGFRHDASGRQIGDQETLAQAQVSDDDVLRLVALSPASGYTASPEPVKAQPRSSTPPAPHAPAEPQQAEPAVLSPVPPPLAPHATPPARSWQPFIAIAAAALVLALVAVAVAIIVGHGGHHETRLVAHETVTQTATAPESEAAESTSAETGESTTPTSTDDGALPAVPTQQMASEIQLTLRSWHEDVVQGDYHAAWELLSARKRAQAEGEGGYGAWAKNQATLRPYLDPAGLQVSVEGTEAESGVAQVDVTGMTWDKPGAHCREWSGITWVKYENGEWRYDPGYSTTQQREREWKSRYTELLGGSC